MRGQQSAKIGDQSRESINFIRGVSEISSETSSLSMLSLKEESFPRKKESYLSGHPGLKRANCYSIESDNDYIAPLKEKGGEKITIRSIMKEIENNNLPISRGFKQSLNNEEMLRLYHSSTHNQLKEIMNRSDQIKDKIYENKKKLSDI